MSKQGIFIEEESDSLKNNNNLDLFSVFQFNQQFIDPIQNETQNNQPTQPLQIQQPLQNQPNIYNFQFFLNQVSCSEFKISRKLKNKITNVRNKNVANYMDQLRDKYIKQTYYNVNKQISGQRDKQDVTKSMGQFLIRLALIRGFGQSDRFFQIFDHCQNMRKNKRTLPKTQEQIAIINGQMVFFREVAHTFFRDPLKAVLMAYLRNQNKERIKRIKKINPKTRQGLLKTIEVLNSHPFRYNLHLNIPEIQLQF